MEHNPAMYNNLSLDMTRVSLDCVGVSDATVCAVNVTFRVCMTFLAPLDHALQSGMETSCT